MGDKVHDVIYNFARVKGLFDTVVGNGEDAPSTPARINKYQEAVRRSAKFSKLAKLPISIDIGNPAFSAGFTWGYRQVESTARVTKSYDIFLKAEPIISATGTLDLIALASFVPVAGQAIKISEMVLAASGIDADFFIQGIGSLGFETKIQIGEDNHKKNDKTSQGYIGLTGDFKIRVEASVTIGGGLVGFIFEGGDIAGAVKTTKYTAYGETGIKGSLATGADEKGPYIEGEIKFSGLIFVAEKKVEQIDGGLTNTEEVGRYVAVEECTLLGGRHYINLEEKKEKNEKIS